MVMFNQKNKDEKNDTDYTFPDSLYKFFLYGTGKIRIHR